MEDEGLFQITEVAGGRVASRQTIRAEALAYTPMLRMAV
jgi:hypothetical protein